MTLFDLLPTDTHDSWWSTPTQRLNEYTLHIKPHAKLNRINITLDSKNPYIYSTFLDKLELLVIIGQLMASKVLLSEESEKSKLNMLGKTVTIQIQSGLGG